MPDTDVNAKVVRTIAEQLFDVWALKQEQESKRRSLLLGSIPAWVALGLSLTGLIWNAAVISSDVANNTRRIGQLEADKRLADAEDKVNGQSLARIEAKVDLLMGERGLKSGL